MTVLQIEGIEQRILFRTEGATGMPDLNDHDLADSIRLLPDASIHQLDVGQHCHFSNLQRDGRWRILGRGLDKHRH